MSFRTTLALLVVLALLGTYARFLTQAPEASPTVERAPYVYSVDFLDIVHIAVERQGKVVSLDWNEEKGEWSFPDSSMGPADQGRMNGIRVLLSGPGSSRVLSQNKVDDLSQFGLSPPQMVATVRLKNGQSLKVLVGNKTANDINFYVQNEGYDPIYLVDYSWGNEMERFVADPPVVKAEGSR